MTTYAAPRLRSILGGLGTAFAGDTGGRVGCSLIRAVKEVKAEISARSSLVFNDLRALAEEEGVRARENSAFLIAERFLLALPSTLPPPELGVDHDGEVVLDWRGRGGRMLSVAIDGTGRITYAARLSASDKEHGTKRFVDEIPRPVLELASQVTATRD